MNKPLVLFVAGLIALGCLSSTATAQKKTRQRATRSASDTQRDYRLKKGLPVVEEDSGETYQPGTNVALDRRVAVKGLGKFVQPYVGTDPGRLAPGQSGELRMVLALKSIYVFEDGMHFSLRYRREQGQISFGNWSLFPPRIGKLDTFFRGLKVYDNTATIVIPVSIGGSAAYGEKAVGFEVEVDVTNGKTGIFHGRHTMDVRGKILVGPPLPVIQENLEAETISVSDENEFVGETAGNLRTGTGESVSAPRTSGTRSTLLVADGSPARTGGVDHAVSAGEAADLDESEQEGSNLMIYSVPAVLLLLILAMAYGKGKGRS